MSTQRIRDTTDKENPRYPVFNLKKMNSIEESPSKKTTVLGDPFHTVFEDDEQTSMSPLGESLMQRKR